MKANWHYSSSTPLQHANTSDFVTNLDRGKSLPSIKQEDDSEKNSRSQSQTSLDSGAREQGFVTNLPYRLSPFLAEQTFDTPILRRYRAGFPPSNPSAMPTPLRAGSNVFSSTGYSTAENIIFEDGGNMVTHLDILHHHMDSNNRKIFTRVAESQNETMKCIATFRDDVDKLLDTTYSQLKSRLEVLESHQEKQTYSKDEVVELLSESTKEVQRELMGPIEEIKQAAVELKNETKQLKKVVSEVSKSLDGMKRSPLMQMRPEGPFQMMHPYHQTSPLSYDPGAWRGHNLPISVNGARYMEPDAFKRYCAEAGLGIGGEPDLGRHQHPYYHGPRQEMPGYSVERTLSPSRQTQFSGNASQLSGQK